MFLKTELLTFIEVPSLWSAPPYRALFPSASKSPPKVESSIDTLEPVAVAIAPPELVVAVLPLNVEFETVKVPTSLKIAPPHAFDAFALFPVNVESTMVSAAVPLLEPLLLIAPPLPVVASFWSNSEL